MGLVLWGCSAKVLEYWMNFSLRIKLNHSWKFQRNWNVPLVQLERSWWAGFNGIYLVRFGFKIWEILIFKWFHTWANGTGHTSSLWRTDLKTVDKVTQH
jgi:hypothetical protein